MDGLVLNKITGHENEINEIKNALIHRKNIRLYKRYSVLLKHFDGFTNRKIAEMSHRGIAYVLHILNLSYTRPTYILAKADKEKQEKF